MLSMQSLVWSIVAGGHVQHQQCLPAVQGRLRHSSMLATELNMVCIPAGGEDCGHACTRGLHLQAGGPGWWMRMLTA